uniref:NADH-ubiquinone oxidoreductase chain 4 n=1 Tax=Liposcelis bostrychophila TaxID=185214 RepID=A0A3Q8C385_LIPBO|nr:NADH dehydrogenase subunit 4 [Liposcelis bostrychophila]ATU74593.1 NADH dehydrogenase subunit 4 [Liposcelis bostrychophila]UNO31807.1 NADH dehydrogenase subunit 4 [Liposcelis bostrychophila]
MIQILILTLFFYFFLKEEAYLIFNWFYCDKASLILNFLNLIILLAFFSMKISSRNYALLILLWLDMALMFTSSSLIQMYIFFELSLVPIFLVIFNSGKQYERLKAGIYLFFFTLTSSLPLLISSIFLLNYLKYFNESSIQLNSKIFLLMFLAFMVKLPIFFVHMWLPKAHVEAPVYGSMVLASLMLKLGGLGLMKVMYFSYKFWMKVNQIFISLFMIGAITAALYCFFQPDLKILIAVSSVSHMTFLFCGLSTFFYESWIGSLLMMACHGFLSPAMFYAANSFYVRVKTRSIYFSKPHFSFYMPMLIFMIYIINFCVPPSLNFFSEIFLSMSLISWSKPMIYSVYAYMILSMLYSIYVFIFSSKHTGHVINPSPLTLSEYKVLIFLVYFSFFSSLMINKFLI